MGGSSALYLSCKVFRDWSLINIRERIHIYETGTRGGSICNENPIITPSINALGFYERSKRGRYNGV